MDGAWDTLIELDVLISKYSEIYRRCAERPVQRKLIYEEPSDEPTYKISKPRFFDPPLQVQRNSNAYSIIRDFARKTKLKKMAILGCGEFSFERYIMNKISDTGIEHIVSVDCDETPMTRGIHLTNEVIDGNSYMPNRNTLPVHIEAFYGDVLHPTAVLSNVDVVLSTEVIEHMPLEDATKMLKAILNEIHPKVFVLSTPNHDFNVVFGMKEGQFRHDDHHFEFTRKQFLEWLKENVPEPYTYEVEYVGEITGHGNLDGATQFAIIERSLEESGRTIENDEKPYDKVADFIFCNGISRVETWALANAFDQFLECFEFDPANIVNTCGVKYWRIPVEEIRPYLPEPTKSFPFTAEQFSSILAALCAPFVYRSHTEDGQPAISIGEETKKQSIRNALVKYVNEETDAD